MITDQQILDHCRRMNGRPGAGIPQWQIEAAEQFRAEIRREVFASIHRDLTQAHLADNLPGTSQ